MFSFKKFLREQCEIQDFDGNRIPAYLPCYRESKWSWFPSKEKTGINFDSDGFDFTELIKWSQGHKNPDAYFIWLKFIPELVVLDFDNVNGVRGEGQPSFKEKRCSEDELRIVLEGIYADIPFLVNKPYTLSRNKGLPHFYLKVRNLPSKIPNGVNILNNGKYDMDILKYGQQSCEMMNAEIYNYQDFYKNGIFSKSFNDVFYEDWDEIKKYFDLEKMRLVEMEEEREKEKKKKEVNTKKINTERDIRRVFQEYHNYHLDKTGSVILCDYSEWLSFGFMVINELGEDGWDLYDEFCSKCNCGKGCYNYEKNKKWFDKTVKHRRSKEEENAITLGTYIKRIKNYGIYIKELKDNFEAYNHKDVAKCFYELWAKHYVKYVPNNKCLYIYDDKKCLWIEKEGSNEVMIHLSDKIGYIYDNVFNELMDDWKKKEDDKEDIKSIQQKQRVILKMKQKLGDATFMKNVYYNLEPMIKDSEFIDLINKDKDYLPLKNGLKICLKNGEISMRDRNDYFTFEIDVDYRPHSDFSNVERYINSIFVGKNKDEDNTEFKKFMQLLFGYFLTGNINHRKIYIFWGAGKNGKTTLINLIKKMLGLFFKTTTEDIVIADKKGNRAKTSPEIFDLCGTRLVIVNELEEGERINSKKMKGIRGGDELSGRNLFEKKIRTFYTQAKLIIITNVKPSVDIDDVASTDSICFIPFNARFNTVLTEEQQEFLEYCKTKEFLNEFFNWCIQGSIRSYVEMNSLTPEPKQLEESKTEYFGENDTFNKFIQEKFDTDEKKYEEQKKLFISGKANQLVSIKDFCIMYNSYLTELKIRGDYNKAMIKKKDIEKKVEEIFGKPEELKRYRFIPLLTMKKEDDENDRDNDDDEDDEISRLLKKE